MARITDESESLSDLEAKAFKKVFLGGVGAVCIGIAVVLVLTSIVVISPGEVGVVYSAMSGVSNTELPAGWHLRMPILQSVYHIKTARDTVNMYYTDYAKCKEDKECTDVALSVPSKEGLIVTLDVSVLYRIQPGKAPEILQRLTSEYRFGTVVPKVRSVIREVTGGMSVTDLYGSGRERLQLDAFAKLKPSLESDGFILDEVLVRDVSMPPQITTAILEKQTVEQSALKKEYEVQMAKKEAERVVAGAIGQARVAVAAAEGDANSTIARANGNAYAVRINAEAEANATFVKGMAQAKATEAINDALARSPQYVQLEVAKQWKGNLPQIIMGGGSIPIIHLPDVGASVPVSTVAATMFDSSGKGTKIEATTGMGVASNATGQKGTPW